MKKLILLLSLVCLYSCDVIEDSHTSDGTGKEVVAIIGKSNECNKLYVLLKYDDRLVKNTYDLQTRDLILDNKDYYDGLRLHLTKATIESIKDIR